MMIRLDYKNSDSNLKFINSKNRNRGEAVHFSFSSKSILFVFVYLFIIFNFSNVNADSSSSTSNSIESTQQNQKLNILNEPIIKEELLKNNKENNESDLDSILDDITDLSDLSQEQLEEYLSKQKPNQSKQESNTNIPESTTVSISNETKTDSLETLLKVDEQTQPLVEIKAPIDDSHDQNESQQEETTKSVEVKVEIVQTTTSTSTEENLPKENFETTSTEALETTQVAKDESTTLELEKEKEKSTLEAPSEILETNKVESTSESLPQEVLTEQTQTTTELVTEQTPQTQTRSNHVESFSRRITNKLRNLKLNPQQSAENKIEESKQADNLETTKSQESLSVNTVETVTSNHEETKLAKESDNLVTTRNEVLTSVETVQEETTLANIPVNQENLETKETQKPKIVNTEETVINIQEETILASTAENLEITKTPEPIISTPVETVTNIQEINEEKTLSYLDISSETTKLNEEILSKTETLEENLIVNTKSPEVPVVSEHLSKEVSPPSNELNQSSLDLNLLVELPTTSSQIPQSNQIQTEKSTSKYCADLNQIKYIFDHHIEPIYLPFLSLLPEDLQIFLQKETFAGLSTASCLFLAFNIISAFVLLIFLSKLNESKRVNLNSSLNEQLITATNKISKLEFDTKTFSSLIEDLEHRLKTSEQDCAEKDQKYKDLQSTYQQLRQTYEFDQKELNKVKTNEAKLVKEYNQAKIDLNSINHLYTQQKCEYDAEKAKLTLSLEQTINELTETNGLYEVRLKELEQTVQGHLGELEILKQNEENLSKELEAREATILMLKNSLMIKKSNSSTLKEVDLDENSDDYVNVVESTSSNEENLDNLMRLAQVQMDLKNLQQKLDDSLVENQVKNKECQEMRENLEEKVNEIQKCQTKITKLEKNIKENEMQIKLLNELREKDTKQHLKALSELDMQLKKKSTDADKVNHFLDQLRVKQERIQELEASLSRVEKQSNQERQTFEKQAHENWLNSKKIEKELKETRAELATLKERLSDLDITNKNLQSENNLLKQQQQSVMQNLYKQQTNSKLSNEELYSAEYNANNPDNSKLEEPPRPSSTSSNPANPLNPNFIPPPMGAFIRPPAGPFPRYPFPVPPMNPAAMAFIHQQQQQQQQQQQHLEQQRLNSSSPSPDLVQQQNATRSMPSIPPMMYHRMHPILLQQQYIQQQQQQQMLSQSAASSQQPSPNANPLLASTVLNDTSIMNNLPNTSYSSMNQTEQDSLSPANNQAQNDNSINFNV